MSPGRDPLAMLGTAVAAWVLASAGSALMICFALFLIVRNLCEYLARGVRHLLGRVL